jgi:hypothetical protein
MLRLFQIELDEIAEILLVIHDEDLFFGHRSLFLEEIHFRAQKKDKFYPARPLHSR